MTPAQQEAVDAVKAAGGNKTEAARSLGISRSSLRSRLRQAREAANEALAEAQAPVDPVEAYRERIGASKTRAENKELLQRLEDAERRQGLLDALARPLNIPKIAHRETGRGVREAAIVGLFSDWHVEETVFPEQVAGLNEYNLTIADARVRRAFEGYAWLAKHHRTSFKIRDGILWLGGDLITGYIHEELEETNGLSPFEATHWLLERLIGGIDYLLKECEFETLTIVCSFGNHGRVHKRKRIKTGAQNSYEWAMYVHLADHFKRIGEKRVRFVLDKSAHQYVEVYGFKLHFHHGDDVRYGGGVGGVSIPLNKRVANWDRVLRCDYHHIGHFHQFLDGGNWMVNGSLIGYSEFALSIGAAVEPPQQGVYLLDSKRGKTCVSPIWADEKGFPKA